MTNQHTNHQFDPTTNPDVQEALSVKYSNKTVTFIPLKSGNLAVFDRGSQLQDIISPEDLTARYITNLSRTFYIALGQEQIWAQEATFHGEPTPAQQAKDIRQQNKPVSTPRTAISAADIEVEF